MITEDDRRFLKSKIRDEGFDYCFECYSNWEEIDDKKFHEARKTYLESKKKLEVEIKRIMNLDIDD